MVSKMRTNKQHIRTNPNEAIMSKHIKTFTTRTQDTLIGDLIGGAALMVTLVGGLYLPGLF